MRRGAHLLLGLGLAGLCGWLVLRDLDWRALAAALAAPDPRWLALAPVFLAAGYACRVARWRAMLATARPGLGLGRCAVPLLGSIAANNLLPFRMGDVLRCVGFSRWLGLDAGTVTATVLVERLLDLLTVLLAFGLALLVLAPGRALVGAGAGALVALGLAALLLLLAPGLLRPLVRLAEAGLRRIRPGAGAAFARFAEPLLATLAILARGRRMPGLILWSAVAWGCEGAVYWAVAKALPAITAPMAAWLAMPAGTLATLLPSTPGHVGTFDYFAIRAAESLGNSAAAATAFAVLVHAVLYLTTTLAGSLCLLVWRLRAAPRDARA